MFNFRVRGLLVFAVVGALAFLPSCGKSSITITLTPAGSPACSSNSGAACAVTLNQGGSVAVTATVANDSTNSGVTWNLGSSVGTLSSETTTSVTYIAPVAISTNTTATVTATSVANTAVTATLTVTIDAVFQFENASLPVATVGLPYNGVLSTEGATGPFTWTIISGSLPAGLTLADSDSASASITGTPLTAGTSTVTIQVSDEAGTPISKTFTLTVNPPPALSVTTKSLPNGTVGTSYNFSLQASFGTSPYTWSIVANSGTLPAGLSLSSGGVISGTPTASGASTFTVQVTDSATPNPGTATADLSLTINPSLAFNSELNGNYAFLLNGFDVNGKRFVAAGSFLANGSAGTISNGLIDTNDSGTVVPPQSFQGTYLISSNGLGTIGLTNGRTFALSFVTTGSPATIQNANLIEFDGTGTLASGVLVQQTPADFATSAITGSYAFGLHGNDSTLASRYALGGEFATDGAGNITGGSVDSDSPTSGPSGAVSLVSSTYSVSSVSNGRGTFSLTTSQGTTSYAFYVVNHQQLFVVEIDEQAGLNFPVVAGMALQQSGSFTNGSLNGTSVFETTALASGAALNQVGLFTTNGSGTLNTAFDKNTGGGVQTSSAGTYSVDPLINGRVTLTSSGLASSDPVVYLVSANEGFVIGTDPSVTFGFLTLQSGGPFSAASLSGSYAGGTVTPPVSAAGSEVDLVVADGVGTLTFTSDISNSNGQSQNQTSSQTFSLLSTSNGRGVVPSSGTTTGVFYMVSPTQYWSLSLVNGNVEVFSSAALTVRP